MMTKLDDKLNLTLQLWDGDKTPTARVIVQLKDKLGALLKAQFEIALVSDGLYTENTEKMPDEEVVTASFFVYKADGVTLDKKYAVAKDVYVRDLAGEIIVENIDAKITGVNASAIEGNIEDNIVLSGEIPTEDLLEISLLDTEILEGTIEEEVII